MTPEQARCRHSEVFSGELSWCSFCGLDMSTDVVMDLEKGEPLWLGNDTRADMLRSGRKHSGD